MVKDRALTYDEVLEVARRATKEIERDWPEWKKQLLEPERVPIRPLDASGQTSPLPKKAQ